MDALQIQFEKLDTDRDGLLSVHEYAVGMTAAGYSITAPEAFEMFRAAGMPPMVDFSGFLKVKRQMPLPPVSPLPVFGPPFSAPSFAVDQSRKELLASLPDEIAAEFTALDSNHDGLVTAMDFAVKLNEDGYQLSLQQTLALFNEAGCSRTGLMDMMAFRKLKQMVQERFSVPSPQQPSASPPPFHHPQPQASPPYPRGRFDPVEKPLPPQSESQDRLSSASFEVPTPIQDNSSPEPPRPPLLFPSFESHSSDPDMPVTVERADLLPPEKIPQAFDEPLPPPHHIQHDPPSLTKPPATLPLQQQTGWLDTQKGFLYRHLPDQPPGVLFIEGGVRRVMENFPPHEDMICTYSATLGCYAVVRRS